MTTTAHPTAFDELLDLPGMTQEMLAKLVGVSSRAVRDWKAGEPISDRGVRSTREILDLIRQARIHIKEDAIVPWLKRQVPDLDHERPIDLIVAGRIGEVHRLLAFLAAGPSN